MLICSLRRRRFKPCRCRQIRVFRYLKTLAITLSHVPKIFVIDVVYSLHLIVGPSTKFCAEVGGSQQDYDARTFLSWIASTFGK